MWLLPNDDPTGVRVWFDSFALPQSRDDELALSKDMLDSNQIECLGAHPKKNDHDKGR